jgi:hypothetical protein
LIGSLIGVFGIGLGIVSPWNVLLVRLVHTPTIITTVISRELVLFNGIGIRQKRLDKLPKT